MRTVQTGMLAGCTAVAALASAAVSSDVAQRSELRRADLAGAPAMEVISSLSEYKTGDQLARHLHHGIETAYVLQGTLVQFPGQPPTMMATGTVVMTLRDVPHAGFKVVGKEPLRLFTVHIVDKGKPLYDWVP